MNEKQIKEIFKVLYDLEIFLEYGKTKEGKELGEFIDKLEKDIINNKKNLSK